VTSKRQRNNGLLIKLVPVTVTSVAPTGGMQRQHDKNETEMITYGQDPW
jgi:hypothetical protein